MQLQIPNQSKENLDTIVEGNDKSNKIVVFVHGFGANKDETNNLYFDVANSLQSNFLTIRFDFSGHGTSAGNREDALYPKMAQDLNTIISWTRNQYPSHQLSIIAHSKGAIATALLCPHSIITSIFTGIPHANSIDTINLLKHNIIKRGGTLNEQGVSTYPHSDGSRSTINPDFWRDVLNTHPFELVSKYSVRTNLTIIHPQNDQLVSTSSVTPYQGIDTLNYLELSGNHTFDAPTDRIHLIHVIKKLLT